MAVPKTAALPLGYAPSRRCERAPIRAAPDWQGAAWAAIRLKPRDPAVRIGGAAALDVDEPVLEHRRHLPRPASADGEAGVAASNLAPGRHDRSGAAGETFGKAPAFSTGQIGRAAGRARGRQSVEI